MRINRRTLTAAVFGVALLASAASCKKKAPIVQTVKPVVNNTPPPVAPEPSKPPASRIDNFTAEPATIQAGQSATLRWTVVNATDIQINQGVGTVTANGQRQVTPTSSTTYTLTATGPGGNATRAATVTVTAGVKPPPPPPAVKTTGVNISGADQLARDGKDAFFDYDSSDLRADGRTAMQQNADLLRSIFSQNPGFKVALEGHCDERGSAEYNLGLGDRRLTSAKDFLVQLGVPADRITTISYGKDRPQCTDADEGCYQRNRRVHLAPAP